jgi:hypothetical protein
LLRGLFTTVNDHLVLPVARYAFPVIIPTMLILVAGWQMVFGRSPGWARPRDWVANLPWVYLLAIDITSVVVIVQYYRQV